MIANQFDPFSVQTFKKEVQKPTLFFAPKSDWFSGKCQKSRKFCWHSFLNWAEKYTAHLYTFKVFIPVCMWNLELLSSFLGSKIQFLLRPGYVESTFFYCKRSNDSKNVELDRPSITHWPEFLNFDQKFETKSEITYLFFHN